jgi:hypothetical protein
MELYPASYANFLKVVLQRTVPSLHSCSVAWRSGPEKFDVVDRVLHL